MNSISRKHPIRENLNVCPVELLVELKLCPKSKPTKALSKDFLNFSLFEEQPGNGRTRNASKHKCSILSIAYDGTSNKICLPGLAMSKVNSTFLVLHGTERLYLCPLWPCQEECFLLALTSLWSSLADFQTNSFKYTSH